MRIASQSSWADSGCAAPAPVACKPAVSPGRRAASSRAISSALRFLLPDRCEALKLIATYAFTVDEPDGYRVTTSRNIS